MLWLWCSCTMLVCLPRALLLCTSLSGASLPYLMATQHHTTPAEAVGNTPMGRHRRRTTTKDDADAPDPPNLNTHYECFGCNASLAAV